LQDKYAKAVVTRSLIQGYKKSSQGQLDFWYLSFRHFHTPCLTLKGISG